ncbi:MAG: helix-turn-helix domain-containing protein [Flavobacteriaceae bacterium]|nr:helix-turn-helix domain-containing protein [Flavobacteriaceae bacterium]
MNAKNLITLNIIKTFTFFIYLLISSSCLNAQNEPSKPELDSSKVRELYNYIEWSSNYASQKLFDSAMKYTARADRIAKELNNPDLSGLVNYNNGKINYWNTNTSAAKEILQSNFDASILHDTIRFKTHVIYSEILQYEHSLKGALKHLLLAEDIVFDGSKLSDRDSVALAFVYIKLGRLHYNFENLSKAKGYYEKALPYSEESDLKTTCLYYLSELYNAENNLEDAITYSLKALAFAKKKNYEVFLPTSYATIGDYYLKGNKADSAIYYAKAGLKDNHDCQLDWLNHIVAEGLNLQGNHKGAIAQLNVALCYTTNDDRTLAILRDLKNTYAKLGDYKNATSYSDSYLKLKETIDAKKVKQEIVEITERYESDKKELKIEILNAENKHASFMIKKQNSRLWFISLSLLLVLLILGLIIYFYQQQKRQRQILYAKNVQLVGRLKESENQIIPIKSGMKAKTDLSTLDEQTTISIKNSIYSMVEDEFYLDCDITLSKTAKAIDTNTSYLSKIINEHYQMSFTNFINELRISYTLKSLETIPELSKYTVDHIAEKSGFASSSAFYKAFKKYTGLTPSYYIKKRLEQQNILT